jgi:hypothetical protein
MPVLDKFRQYHYEATAKVSENTRTLALSAIAIVWLFKHDNDGTYEIPEKLLIPLMLVIMAMTLDFCQYVYRSIAWHIIFRMQEKRLAKKQITETSELYVNSWVNFLAYCFFYTKVVCLGFAYLCLIKYFICAVKWI